MTSKSKFRTFKSKILRIFETGSTKTLILVILSSLIWLLCPSDHRFAKANLIFCLIILFYPIIAACLDQRPTSFSGDNVVEVDDVQDGVQVLVTEASGSHVVDGVWVDHLVPQCTHGHVWPGETHTHTDTHDPLSGFLVNLSFH